MNKESDAYDRGVTPSVTAIVVNWNGADHLHDCLSSLDAQSYKPLDVIVVDNGSTDESAEIVAGYKAAWLPLGRNTGLAPAFNRGAELASGELLLFLNNDMRFPENFVERLVACFERNPGCGAVDAVQRDWDEDSIVHGATHVSRCKRLTAIGRYEFVFGGASFDQPTLFPSGANTLIAQTTFQSIGLWDERFLAGWEDVDLGWRLRLGGLRVLLASNATCLHRVGASSHSGEGAAVRDEAAIHGPLIFAMKHLPMELAVLGLLRVFASAIAALVRRDSRRAQRAGRVIKEVLREAPSVVRERRANYGAARIKPRALWRQIRELGY